MASSSPSVQPESVDFGDQAIGQRSGSRSVQVTNSTNDAIVISSVGFTGADARDFVLAGARTCVAGASVPKDDSCSVGVSFAPTTQGDRTATLAIALNDGSNLSVALSGTGTGQATAVASTSQLSFGSVTVGGAAATQQATIANTGNAPLPVQEVSVGGANAGDFTLAKGTTCVAGTPVPASGSCVVAVSFAPAATGDRSATLSVASGGDNATTLQIALSGTGVGQTQGDLTPSQANFGSADVGATSPPTTFTLKSSGTADLPITTIAMQGASPRSFEVTSAGSCKSGGSVASGSSCTVQVVFVPIAAGAATATLSVVAGGEEFTAPLSGTGVEPPTTTTTAP